VVKIVEEETLEEYGSLEYLTRREDLNGQTIGIIFFENLVPFRGTDFYKYRKLRRILEIRLKHEGKKI
jgi:hypothetical protein